MHILRDPAESHLERTATYSHGYQNPRSRTLRTKLFDFDRLPTEIKLRILSFTGLACDVEWEGPIYRPFDCLPGTPADEWCPTMPRHAQRQCFLKLCKVSNFFNAAARQIFFEQNSFRVEECNRREEYGPEQCKVALCRIPQQDLRRIRRLNIGVAGLDSPRFTIDWTEMLRHLFDVLAGTQLRLTLYVCQHRNRIPHDCPDRLSKDALLRDSFCEWIHSHRDLPAFRELTVLMPRPYSRYLIKWEIAFHAGG